MSDVAAPAAPAAPAAAAPEAPKPHHSHLQPRETGKFAGAPVPPEGGEAAPPVAERPRWKVGDQEFDNPDDLVAFASERHVERRALEENYRARQEHEARVRALEAELERAKKGEVLDAQTRQRIALEEARRYQEEQELASLPEEQRRFYLQVKEMQRREREATEKLNAIERQRQEAEAKAKQEAEAKQMGEMRQQMATTIRSAMEKTGIPMSDDLARLVSAEMRSGLMAGVDYPPEVLARRVQQRWYKATAEQFKAAKPEDLFKRIPTLVDALNALEDPAILRQLAPKLGDRLRRLNLESIGARPTLVPGQGPTPPVVPAGQVDTRNLKPGDPAWEEVIRQRTRG